ncbi:ABC-type glycerol-3-phosphate transport system, substrate-binding protein [Gracilibacillus orientalis]|uniref:ABC-type glycerol-3-phosphate transport system, substrate-binding protein n=1 Tax=Gracilibacillus orientalis TaxID=334253 RepID=A0A1I4NFI9_9BACI|nr:extracellular solute-binding protein [Gracilibacillus orientalis]SFM14060.1 ABC-type glycerol-3-phosphate transport system, substrate-binding protein [Gracilibacillus orientalis]
MFSTKSFLGIVLFLLMTVTLIGCNNESSSENTGVDESSEVPETEVDNSQDWNGQTVKVQLIGDFSMEDSTDPITGETTPGLKDVKEEFERQHPGATVEFILMPWEGYTEKTQAMLTSSEADVYQMPGIADFAAQGLLEPLQPYMDKDEEFSTDIFIDQQVDGWKALGPESSDLEIFGLPFFGDARFITYDKKLFDDWGVEYLSEHPTMEEIGDKAAKMTGTNPVTGEQNYGIWFRGDWSSAFTLVNAAEGLGGKWGTGFAWDEVEFEFNSPEMVKSLNWLLEMQELAPEGIVSNQGQEKWMTKDNNIAIMLNTGPGELVEQVQAQGLEDRIAIAQEFKNEDGAGGLFAGSPITMAKDSENKDLAWEWLKYATSEYAQQYFYTTGAFPSVKSALEWESVKEHEDLLGPVFEAMSTPYNSPRYHWAAAQPRFILTSEIEAALTDQRNAQEALDKAQKESTEWLENR